MYLRGIAGLVADAKAKGRTEESARIRRELDDLLAGCVTDSDGNVVVASDYLRGELNRICPEIK